MLPKGALSTLVCNRYPMLHNSASPTLLLHFRRFLVNNRTRYDQLTRASNRKWNGRTGSVWFTNSNIHGGGATGRCEPAGTDTAGGREKEEKEKKERGRKKGEGKGRLRYRCPLIFLSFHPRKSFTGIIKGCHFAVIYILYITPSIVHEARSCSIRKAFNFGRTVSNNRPPGRESRGTWIFWWMENSQVGRNASLLFVHCLYSYDTGSIIYIFLYFIFGIVFEPVI